jgi:regulator of replication initiation timing
MRLDNRVTATVMDRIKAYVDARIDEKIAIALSREELRKQLAASDELSSYIENRVRRSLQSYRT